VGGEQNWLAWALPEPRSLYSRDPFGFGLFDAVCCSKGSCISVVVGTQTHQPVLTTAPRVNELSSPFAHFVFR